MKTYQQLLQQRRMVHFVSIYSLRPGLLWLGGCKLATIYAVGVDMRTVFSSIFSAHIPYV